jgi:hypothetical protein
MNPGVKAMLKPPPSTRWRDCWWPTAFAERVQGFKARNLQGKSLPKAERVKIRPRFIHADGLLAVCRNATQRKSIITRAARAGQEQYRAAHRPNFTA